MKLSIATAVISVIALMACTSCVHTCSSGGACQLAETNFDKPPVGEIEQSEVRALPAVHVQPIREGDDLEVPGLELIQPLPAPTQRASEKLHHAGTYTLAEIEQMALANNPTLVQAMAAIDGQVGKQVQAGLRPNPRAGYLHNEIGNSGKAGQQGAFVAQEFITGGKLQLEQHVAGRGVKAASFEHLAQQQRVLTSVRIAFYDVLAAQETIKLTKELLQTAEEGVETTEALIKGGEASRVDLLQVRVELHNARLAHQQAKNRVTAAWSHLAMLVGSPNMQPSTLAGTLIIRPAQLEPEQVAQAILSASPELAAAQQRAYRAEVALQRAGVEWKPNIDVLAAAQHDYSTEDTYVSVQFEVPLPIFDKNQGNIIRAQADVTRAYRDIERIELNVRNRLAAALEEYNNATAEVKQYSESIIPDAQESLDLLIKAFKSEGKIDFIRLLTAQRTNFQSRIDYMKALRRWWAAKLQIDGLLLSGGLEKPSSVDD